MQSLAKWLVEGRIILAQGTLASDILNYRNQMIADMMTESGQQPLVHLIIDYRGADNKTDEALRLRYYVDAQHDGGNQALIKHPLLGWSISVDPPGVVVKLAASIISQQNNYRWHHTPTGAEALDFLATRDSTLPDLTPFKEHID